MVRSFDIVDSLVFLGQRESADHVFAALDRAGIDAAVLAPARDRDRSDRAANDRVAKLRQDAPDTRRQVGRVDPYAPDVLDEVARCVEVHGVAGFYLNPREESFTISGTDAAPTIAAIAAHGLPAIIETGTPWVSEPLQVATVAHRHPELDIVMTNGGQLNISGLGQAEAFAALEQAPRLRILTSGVYRQDFIETVITRFGAGRVLFASAAPVFTPEYEILRVLGAECSDNDRAMVAGEAARQLFW